MSTRYVNPFTDFGFKKIFGEEASHEILRSFLNSILPEDKQIRSLEFQNTEKLGEGYDYRKALFDVYCITEKGEHIIVELQKARQRYFKDRTIFYATFPIRNQAPKSDWDFELKAVYCIGILDFKFNDYTEAEKDEVGRVLHSVELKDQNNKVFYDKLKFFYLEMPNFKKIEAELVTEQDKWLYFLKHLVDFDQIPRIFSGGVFEEAFHRAEMAQMPAPALEEYERSLKDYRDAYNVVQTARIEGKLEGLQEGLEKGIQKGIEKGKAEGKIEGKAEGKTEVARSMKTEAMPVELIVKLTGLTKEEIESL